MNMIDSCSTLPSGSRDIKKEVEIKREKPRKHECSGNKQLVPLPVLKTAKPSVRYILFIKKCRQCCYLFDFTDPNSDLKSKDVKTAALYELDEFILDLKDDTNEAFLVTIFADVFKMFTRNAFRALPPSRRILGPVPSEPADETMFEPSWPHLNLVYDLFLNVLQKISPSSYIKRHIEHFFILNLLKLFNSEDPRERDYCKTILHRIYSQFPHIRADIRKQVSYIFYSFIYETEEFNGITELLEMWVSVINGMTIPLREKHRTFLLKVLLPLYKVRTLMVYNTQLSLCVQKFIEKEPNLAEPFIKGLMKIWPLKQYYKEIIFLDTIEDVIYTISPHMFKKIMVPLFLRLTKSMSSLHFHVVERVFRYWNNEYVLLLIRENAEVIFPIVIPALYENYRSHWNIQVDTLCYEVMRIMLEINSTLYVHCAQPCIKTLRESGVSFDISSQNLNTTGQSISKFASLSDLSTDFNDTSSSTDEKNPVEEANTEGENCTKGKHLPHRYFKTSA